MAATVGLAFGQGRPPKDERARWREGNTRHRGRTDARKPEAPGSLPVPPPPRGMAKALREAWLELAPAACAMRTLTVETQPAFRELVEMIVIKRDMYRRIKRDGFMVPLPRATASKAGKGRKTPGDYRIHPLFIQYKGMMQLVQTMMHRFRIAPVGKEVVPGEPGGDEWDEFDQQPTADGPGDVPGE